MTTKGHEIVPMKRSNQASVDDSSERRSVHTVVIPHYCARGWSGVSPDIYSFIVIYTEGKWSQYTRYRIDSVDYVGYPSGVPEYPRSKLDLEKAIQHGVAKHLGVDIKDVRMKRTAMWYMDGH